MNNQKNKNEEGIDLSQWPINKREEVEQPKRLSFESFKKSWQRMRKENQIFIIFIIIAFILMIILLVSLVGRIGGKEIIPLEEEKYIPEERIPQFLPPTP